jgi:amino-acid N-acetyltransferase
MFVRHAQIADIPAAAEIINDAAEYGLMLPRSLASMYEDVRDFHVAVLPGEGEGGHDKVIGVCGLKIVWANLAEVFALAVSPEQRGKGIGRQLVLSCLDEAEQLGIKRLMTLTYQQEFFDKLGFTVVDRQQLPLKVWSECVRCPKNQACDEIAMIRVLDEVIEIKAPEPKAPPADEYIVPMMLSNARRKIAPALPEYP